VCGHLEVLTNKRAAVVVLLVKPTPDRLLSTPTPWVHPGYTPRLWKPRVTPNCGHPRWRGFLEVLTYTSTPRGYVG